MPDWDEVEGRAKEKAGEATDDERLKREGQVQSAWGETKDDAGDAMDEAEDKAEDVKDRI